jgi:hypothetical protein
MATKLQTRILNKISTWTEWESVKSTFKPLRGEICIVEIPSGTSSTGLTPPATGIKVGDGQHFFGELPWIQAVAGDVTAWCKENMADFDSFKAQVAAAVADSEGGLQDAIDSLGERVTNLEATVNTGDNSNAKLRQAITAVDGKADANAQNITGLTSTKADKTQVATDIATAKTAVLGQKEGADFNGTVMGAYEAAAAAKDAADAASEAAGKALTDAKAYTDGKVTDILGKNDDNSNFVGTVKGAYAAAAAAQGKADTNAGEITSIKEDIQEINDMLGGAGEQTVAARLTALETNDGVQDGKIKDNADAIDANAKAIKAEEERAMGVEGDHETRIATMENFWKAADDPVGTIDKLSEIVDYISKDTTGALDMAKDIEANAKAIEDEVERAEKAEADLQDAIDALYGDAAVGTDTLGTVKDLAEEAKQAASDNLNTAKAYTDAAKEAVLGEKGYAGTVKGAYEAAAAASAAAATADGKAVAAQGAADAAQGAADAAQDDADAANTAIEKLLGSSVSEANGKISTISFADGKISATRKDIVMADMSATEVFIFDCGSATVNAANLTV